MKTNFTSQLNRAAWAIRKAAAQAMNVRVSDVSWKVCLEMARNNETFLGEVKMEKPVFRTWFEIDDVDEENSFGDTHAQKEFSVHSSTEQKKFWVAEIRPNRYDEEFTRIFQKAKKIHASLNITVEEGYLYEAQILDERSYFYLDHEANVVKVEASEIPAILAKIKRKRG